MKTIQINSLKIGTMVTLSHAVVNSYGFANALPEISPADYNLVDGCMGEIISRVDSYPESGEVFPDTCVRLPSGRELWVDICHLTPIVGNPFKVGQRVRVSNEKVSNYGFPEGRPFHAAAISTDKRNGQEGVIVRLGKVYKTPSLFPDVHIRFADGEVEPLEICQLTLLEEEKVKPVVDSAGAKKKLSPQCVLVLKHLQQGNTITMRSALMDFGVMSLSRRIADLKEQGHNITSVLENNKLTGQRYARYTLNMEKAA